MGDNNESWRRPRLAKGFEKVTFEPHLEVHLEAEEGDSQLMGHGGERAWSQGRT